MLILAGYLFLAGMFADISEVARLLFQSLIRNINSWEDQ